MSKSTRNGTTANLVVMPERIVPDWVPAGFSALLREDFNALLEWQPEIVLLGTGTSIRFPHPRLTADLTGARVGVDVMDFQAACRTSTSLAAEGRRVAAALDPAVRRVGACEASRWLHVSLKQELCCVDVKKNGAEAR